jgi:hypothetical protein
MMRINSSSAAANEAENTVVPLAGAAKLVSFYFRQQGGMYCACCQERQVGNARIYLEAMFSFSVSTPMSNQQGTAKKKAREGGGSEGCYSILGTDQGLVYRQLVA